jgi:hypothetical protein
MFEHFLNCHGEWNALLALAPSWVLVPYWVRSKAMAATNE